MRSALCETRLYCTDGSSSDSFVRSMVIYNEGTEERWNACETTSKDKEPCLPVRIQSITSFVTVCDNLLTIALVCCGGPSGRKRPRKEQSHSDDNSCTWSLKYYWNKNNAREVIPGCI